MSEEPDNRPQRPNRPGAGFDGGRPPQPPTQRMPGIRMGAPFGVPIYVAPTWFLVAGFVTLFFAPSNSQIPGLGGWKYAVSFVFAVFLYLSVTVHELAHSVVAKRIGLPVRRISIYFLGGISEIEREPETAGREFAVAIAGPALSVVLAAIGYGVWQAMPQGTSTLLLVLDDLIGSLWAANLLVAAFNLLPGLPLDGGRVLRAIVWGITKRQMSGTVTAAWIGRGLAIAVVIVALRYGSLNGGIDLYTLVMGVFIASFIWLGASQSLAVAKLRQRLPNVSARELTRRAIPVEAQVPLGEALRRAREVGARALVVVTGDGRPTALVDEAAVVATPEQRRPWVDVASVSRTLASGMTLSADLSGERLINAMRSTPSTEYLVVEPNGDIFGVLSTADVQRAVASRS